MPRGKKSVIGSLSAPAPGEDEVQLSQELLSGILEDSINGFFILNSGYRIIHGNRAFRTMFRSMATGPVDVPVYTLLEGESRRVIKRQLRAVSHRKSPGTVEIELVVEDVKRHFLVSLSPVRSSGTRGNLIYGFVQDVSELKSLQYQLENERNYNRSIIETVKLGFVLVNDGNEYLDYNSEYLAILDRGEHELEGKTFYDFTDPHYIEAQKAMMREMVRSGKSFIFEKEFIRKDGSRVPVLVSMSRLPDKQGRPIGNFAFIRDISDQKQIENALKQQNLNIRKLITIYNEVSARFMGCANGDEVYASLVESMQSILGDADVEILMRGDDGFSPAYGAGRLTGTHRGPVSERNSLVMKLLGTRDAPILVRDIATEMNDEDFSVFPGISRHRSALFIPVQMRGVQGLVIILAFRNELQQPDEYVINLLAGMSNLASITIEKILSVEEQNAMRTTLDRYDRLTSMGRIIAGVAHEINNPLSIMQLDLDEMKDIASELQVKERASFDELVRSLQEEISRLSGLVKQLKDYSNPTGIGLETVFIDDLLKDFPIKIFLKNLQKKGVRVRLKLGAGNASIQIPRNRLIQVLMNLCANADDAIAGVKAPELTIETGRKEGERPQVYIMVSDNGPGIPAGMAQKIFEPFYTTKKSEGTGLGLSISYSIVKSYSGEILVESGEGRGARFIIHFPESSVSP